MENFFLEISSETVDGVVKIITGGIVAGIGYMLKRQLNLQEKQHETSKKQAEDIKEIKTDFKITNLRYDMLEGRTTKNEVEIEKIKEKIN